MSDLELTKLCAEAAGIKIEHEYFNRAFYIYHPIDVALPLFAEYQPLIDDAQAMALVKKFALRIDVVRPLTNPPEWFVSEYHVEDVQGILTPSTSKNLNRAIVECVAKFKGP